MKMRVKELKDFLDKMDPELPVYFYSDKPMQIKGFKIVEERNRVEEEPTAYIYLMGWY